MHSNENQGKNKGRQLDFQDKNSNKYKLYAVSYEK